MKNIIIAPLGDRIDNLFVGIREFPTEKIYLLTPKGKEEEAGKAKRDLQKFRVPVFIVPLLENTYEGIFKSVSQIKNAEEGNILINVSTGDRNMQCAATSAAFVNGIKAFHVDGERALMLPVLKFSYYKLLTDRKMSILRTLLHEEGCCSSLEELSRKTRMSLPLISYHMNGSKKSEGLASMGLVDLEEHSGRVSVKLSMLGRLLMKGYVEPPGEKQASQKH
jgi:DNA-binding transcriptional ArsR family regulator